MIRNSYKLFFIIILSPFFIFGQSIVIKQNHDYPISDLNINNHNILNKNNFSMNHGFSLATSMHNKQSQSLAIYSNQTQYKISENLKIKTNINLIQSQGALSYSNSPQPNIRYGIGIEYRLNSNSIFTFQIVNQNTNLTNKIILP